MRIVFCGTGDIGTPALRALLDLKKYEVCAVITQPDKPAGRDMKPRASAIKLLALERGVPVLQPVRLRSEESVAALRAWDPDVVVVVAYGQLLSPEVLAIPKLACLNLHASLLPRHRGASPIQAAILAGDADTGITVMYMDEGLDTGDILLEERFAILQTETAGELHNRLASVAAPTLLRALALLESGNAPRIPQDPVLTTHASKMKKTDGWLDWQQPAAKLALRVRAMSPWPGAYARWGGHLLKIHEATASEASGAAGEILESGNDGLFVAAGTGSLRLITVQLEGRKRLNAGELLRGFPMPAGTSFDLSFPPAV